MRSGDESQPDVVFVSGPPRAVDAAALGQAARQPMPAPPSGVAHRAGDHRHRSCDECPALLVDMAVMRVNAKAFKASLTDSVGAAPPWSGLPLPLPTPTTTLLPLPTLSASQAHWRRTQIDPLATTTPRLGVMGMLLWLGLTVLAAALGGAGSTDAASFYAFLDKPVWAPPAMVFGPVWTALYALMALSAALVWRERVHQRVGSALTVFVLQLGVNALWSWLFFAWHQGAWALLDSALLLGLLLWCTHRFWRIRPLAGALLLPSVAWVMFATGLNAVMWRMNPQFLG